MVKKIIGLFLISFAAKHAMASKAAQLNCNGEIPVILEEGLQCSDAESVWKLFEDVKKVTGVNSIHARVFLQKNGYDAWSTFGGLMYINKTQMLFGKPRTEQHSKLVWVHEIGHLVFNEMLRSSFPEISCFSEYQKKDAELKWEAKDPTLDTDKTLAHFWNETCLLGREIQKPYSELFADIFLSVYRQSLSAPAEAMKMPHLQKREMEKANGYDFAKLTPMEDCEQNEHFYFSPTRYKIGKQLLRFPLNREENKQLLSKVFELLKNDLLKNWKQQRKVPSDCKAANIQLTSAI